MTRPERRNGMVLGALLSVTLGMLALSFAAVPLYRVFCQVTGFGGTTQRAPQGATHILDRKIEIRFNTDVNGELPWAFRPDQRSVTLKVGETGLATFHAQNLSAGAITGAALYNVTPEKAGKYFVKMQCFCFNQQTLHAHESAELPVAFYVDPSIADDRNLDDVTVITLSYTFFKAQSQALGNAAEAAADALSGPAAKPPEKAATAPGALAATRGVE